MRSILNNFLHAKFFYWLEFMNVNVLFSQANKVSSKYIDVEAVMNVWIKQAGYPIVTVRRLGGNQFELTQERFLLEFQQNNSSTSVTPANK